MVWCEALWIHTGSAPGPGGAGIRNLGIPEPLTHSRPQGKAWEGNSEGWGQGWEQRTARGHGGTAWREGQRERIDQICSNPEACSKYWINVKTPRVGRERPLPTKKQSPVLHVNTFLRDSQRQLVQVKNNRDWQLVQSSPPLTVRVSQN